MSEVINYEDFKEDFKEIEDLIEDLIDELATAGDTKPEPRRTSQVQRSKRGVAHDPRRLPIAVSGRYIDVESPLDIMPMSGVYNMDGFE
tara:strand:- start:687 stop:953 length:267 start_codon:yes stop_codon:yes gene_type:complete